MEEYVLINRDTGEVMKELELAKGDKVKIGDRGVNIVRGGTSDYLKSKQNLVSNKNVFVKFYVVPLEFLAQKNLTQNEWKIFLYMCRHLNSYNNEVRHRKSKEILRNKEIANNLGLDMSVVSRNISKLENKGLVKKMFYKDRYVYVLNPYVVQIGTGLPADIYKMFKDVSIKNEKEVGEESD